MRLRFGLKWLFLLTVLAALLAIRFERLDERTVEFRWFFGRSYIAKYWPDIGLIVSVELFKGSGANCYPIYGGTKIPDTLEGWSSHHYPCPQFDRWWRINGAKRMEDQSNEGEKKAKLYNTSLHQAELDAAWQEMCEQHVQPSVLFKVARHLLECESCRRAFETYQQDFDGQQVVHYLWQGVTLCGKRGFPSEWEHNHSWVGPHDNMDEEVNCPFCKMKLREE